MDTSWVGVSKTFRGVVLAFSEFLTLPTAIVVAFVFLAAAMDVVNWTDVHWLGPIHHFLDHYAFRNASTTSSFLSTVAAGIITLTSISFSLLVLAVQQSASELTSQVYDQFLRRPINQIILGYFVGLTLYTVVVLVSVTKGHNPVIPAGIGLLLSIVGLYFLVVLLYNAINQIRPVRIMEKIHDMTVAARDSQRPLIDRTRRSSQSSHPVRGCVRASHYGYLTKIELKKLSDAVSGKKDLEVVVRQPMGSFFAEGDTIAEIKAASEEGAAQVTPAVAKAFQVETSRQIRGDPEYGIQELVTIAWASSSTAHQNLAPGRLSVDLLRDLLIRFVGYHGDPGERLPVVYPDNVLPALLTAFESVIEITGKSAQFVVLSRAVRALANVYDKVPGDLQNQIDDMVLVLSQSVTMRPLTIEVNAALDELIGVLEKHGEKELVDQLHQAIKKRGGSVLKHGTLPETAKTGT